MPKIDARRLFGVIASMTTTMRPIAPVASVSPSTSGNGYGSGFAASCLLATTSAGVTSTSDISINRAASKTRRTPDALLTAAAARLAPACVASFESNGCSKL